MIGKPIRSASIAVALALVASLVTSCCGLGCGALPRLPWQITQGRLIRGSGRMETREISQTGFTRLEISHAFDVYLTRDGQYQVVVTADENLWDVIQVERSGSTLKLGLKEGTWSVQNATLEAEIRMPTLEVLTLSGASRLTGQMDTPDLALEVSGASRVSLAGDGADLRADVSGASQIDLADFVVRNAAIEASGASQVDLFVTGRLDAEASGASRIYYLGDPSLGRIETSGAGSVRPR